MSAEDEKENVTPEDTPAEEPAAEAARKPARARKAAAPKAEKAEGNAEEPAAKRPAAKKPAAKKSGEDEPAASAEESTAKGPAAKRGGGDEPDKPAAKKARKAKKAAGEDAPAAEQPSAKRADVAEYEPPASIARRKPVGERRQVVRAHARYVRTSARKARMVCGHIRGKSVPEARAILAFTPRDVARDWSKLLESAVANAENNHELLEDDLIVREAYADEGPTIKRFRPRAMGRATPIRKRTSHLTITLTPRS